MSWAGGRPRGIEAADSDRRERVVARVAATEKTLAQCAFGDWGDACRAGDAYELRANARQRSELNGGRKVPRS